MLRLYILPKLKDDKKVEEPIIFSVEDEIINKYNKGDSSTRKLALEYGMSQSKILRIINKGIKNII